MKITTNKIGINLGTNSAIAIIFAVLMVLSMVSMPALAAPGGGSSEHTSEYQAGIEGVHSHGDPGPDRSTPGNGPPNDGDDDGEDRDIQIPAPTHEANSTVDAHRIAVEELDGLDVESEAEPVVEDAIDAFNASADAYYESIYVDSPDAFATKADAQRQLKTLVGEYGVDDEAVTFASDVGYDASNISARLAIANAITAVEENEEAFDNPGQRKQAEQRLDTALKALDRANDAIGNDTPHRGPPGDDLESVVQSRHNAIKHHETAVTHADKAFEAVEDATEPSLSLSQGTVYEEDDRLVVVVQGDLEDVRSYRYDAGEVNAIGENGEDLDSDAMEFQADSLAGNSASGTTVVDLGPDLQNATVTVEAISADDDRSAEATLDVEVTPSDVVDTGSSVEDYTEVEVSDEPSGVTVEVGGEGISERDVNVTDVTPESDEPFRAAPVVGIESQAEFDEAEVTIPLHEGIDPSENLSIYTWDTADEDGWTPVETEIDPENGTATATVDSFSFFSVFQPAAFDDYMSKTITLEDHHLVDPNGEGTGEVEPLDIMLVVDESGSMSGARIENARLASKRFVGGLLEDDRAGLVGYSSSSRLYERLTTDHDQLNRSIDSLSAGGLTNTGAGLNDALDEFEANGKDDHRSVIILLSDGHTNRGPNPIGIAREAADRDIEISTVGLGSGIDENELRTIADETDGDFWQVESAADLPDTFERIAENQTDVALRDTNDDGIPDAVADANPRLPNSVVRPGGYFAIEEDRLDIDPVLTDTSGDGLLDNETVNVQWRVFEEDGEQKLEARVTSAVAHPAFYDTAGNGLSDHQEVQLGADPWTADTSGDGLIDYIDPEPPLDSMPPEVRTWSDSWEDYFIVDGDEDLDTVETSAYYDPTSPLTGSYWSEDKTNVQWLDDLSDEDRALVEAFIGSIDEDDDVFVGIEGHGWLNENPEELEVTVADAAGNEITYNVDLSGDEPRIVEATVVAGGAAVAFPEPVSSGAGAIAIATAVGGALVLDFALNRGGLGDSSEIEEIEIGSSGGIIGEEPVENWPEDLEITLPSGVNGYEGEYRLPSGQERGYGEEHVIRTPGIEDTQDIEEIIRAPNAIEEKGEYTGYIGDNPNGQGEIILWILEETLVFAEQTTVQEEAVEEITEEVNEEVPAEEQLDEQDVEETIEDTPKSVNRELRYTNYIYELREGIMLVLRMSLSGIVGWYTEWQEPDDEDDEDLFCDLDADEVDMAVDSVDLGEFDAADSAYESFEGTFEDTQLPIETELRCVFDRDTVVETYADDPTDITDGSLGENVSVEFVDERGLALEWPEDGFDEGDASEIGPDIIAYDEAEEEWLIVEAKTTTSTEAVGKGLLDTDAYDGDAQLHNDWIRNSLEKLENEDRIDPELVDQIDTAIATNNVTKEVVLVRDVEGASHRTLREPQSDDTDISLEDVAGVDKVTIVELAAGE